MINLIENGDIFISKCNILVNPVNCIGVMGAGLSKQFMQRYPLYARSYKNVCANNKLQLGNIDIYTGAELCCIGICSLPTKFHWKDTSKLIPITNSCKKLRLYLDDTGYSCAIPAIGCGLGGLDFALVKDMVYTVFDGCKSYIDFLAPREF